MSLTCAFHAEQRLQARHDAGEAGLLDGLDDEVDRLVGLRRLIDDRTHLLIEAHSAQRAQHLLVGQRLLGLRAAELAPRTVVDAVFAGCAAGQAYQDVAGHAHRARDQYGVPRLLVGRRRARVAGWAGTRGALAVHDADRAVGQRLGARHVVRRIVEQAQAQVGLLVPHAEDAPEALAQVVHD